METWKIKSPNTKYYYIPCNTRTTTDDDDGMMTMMNHLIEDL